VSFRKIALENFKPYKYTEIDLSAGITTIVGSSEAGKTCIAQALRWLAKNRPLSEEEVRREGTKKSEPVSVRVWLDSGESVERRKERKFNGYRIYSADGALAAEFNAIKGDVPEEVSTLLALDDACFQHQYDPYFMLQESAGEVARKFNRAADIGAIDSIISYLKSEVHSADVALLDAGDSESRLEELLGSYDFLEEGQKLISQAKEALGFIEEAVAFRTEVEHLIDRAERLEHQLIQAKKALASEALLDRALSCSERIRSLYHEREVLLFAIEQVVSIQSRLSLAKKEQTKTAKAFEQALVKARRCPLCGSVISVEEKK